MELLWSNPNPSSNLTTNVAINVDTTQYAHIIALVAYTAGTANGSNPEYPNLLLELNKDGPNFSELMYSSSGWGDSSNRNDRICSYRGYKVDSDKIMIHGQGSTAGYIYTLSGGKENSPRYAIPVAIYGIKKSLID